MKHAVQVVEPDKLAKLLPDPDLRIWLKAYHACEPWHPYHDEHTSVVKDLFHDL